nr:hypothetical protein [Streptomyces verrucosisporus]
MMVDVRDLEGPSGGLDALPGPLRNVPQLRQDEPGHGGVPAVGPVSDADSDVRQVVDGEGAGDQQRPVGLGTHRRHVPVGLVVDLPDDLLQQILDGHDPVHHPVLVDDQRELLTGGHQAPQGLRQPRELEQVNRRPGQLPDDGVAALAADQIAQMDDADDVVQVSRGGDRGAGVPGSRQHGPRPARGHATGQRENRTAGDQRRTQGEFVDLQGAGDDRALLGRQTAEAAHQLADLLGAGWPTALPRVPAEQPDEQVRRPAQSPYRGP